MNSMNEKIEEREIGHTCLVAVIHDDFVHRRKAKLSDEYLRILSLLIQYPLERQSVEMITNEDKLDKWPLLEH